MFRVALIAYLSLTTVLGPLPCCCNAQQLSSMVNGSQCCGKPVAQQTDAKKANGAGHHHGQTGHCHEHSPVEEAPTSEQAPVPSEHDGQNCPCGKHHAKLVAAATNLVQLNTIELQDQPWNVLVAVLPEAALFAPQAASINSHLRPAKLYGREMLRAYQIMRC